MIRPSIAFSAGRHHFLQIFPTILLQDQHIPSLPNDWLPWLIKALSYTPKQQLTKHKKQITPWVLLENSVQGEAIGFGFNNMVPVHKDALVEFDIDAEPDEKYRELLKRQARLCNRMKADILNHAQMTYFDVVNGKNKFLIGISCDFKKLEGACKAYKKDFKPKKRKERISAT